MPSRLRQKRGATAPVMNVPSGPLRAFDESASMLFCTEEEEDAAIQAMLEEDPEVEDGIPLEQFRAEMDLLIASLRVRHGQSHQLGEAERYAAERT